MCCHLRGRYSLEVVVSMGFNNDFFVGASLDAAIGTCGAFTGTDPVNSRCLVCNVEEEIAWG